MLRNKNVFKLLSLTLGFIATTCFARNIKLTVYNNLGTGTPVAVVNSDTREELFAIADGSNETQEIDDSTKISLYAGILPIELRYSRDGEAVLGNESVKLSILPFVDHAENNVRIFANKDPKTDIPVGQFD